MKIFVESSRDPAGQFHINLKADNWDDFGLKTTFLLTVRSGTERHIIGQVKIIDCNVRLGSPKIQNGWTALPDSFCSLGQSIDFYRRLRNLTPEHEKAVLVSLRDCAFDRNIYSKFSETPQFVNSLTRFTPAQAALKFAREQFSSKASNVENNEDKRAVCDFTFRSMLRGFSKEHILHFSFSDPTVAKIPSRICVIIGRNGTGKTQLLSNLAKAVSGYGHDTQDEASESHRKSFPKGRPEFTNVIVVAYSAFDSFEIPGKSKIEQKLISKTGSIFGYKYCGLRERTNDGSYRIKRSIEIFEEFKSALNTIDSLARRETLRTCLSHVLSDPALSSVDETNIIEKFQTLSSGQKIVLAMLTKIVSHAESSSLIIVDEPETHLHPSLTSSFMHSLRSVLDEFDSFAIVATHSPVVLQETPSRYVNVLSGTPNFPTVKALTRESFGEELSTLTEDVFGLPFEQSNFYAVLRSLSDQGMSIKDIERLFEKPLGMTARSFIA